jgi:hypothetical protein
VVRSAGMLDVLIFGAGTVGYDGFGGGSDGRVMRGDSTVGDECVTRTSGTGGGVDGRPIGGIVVPRAGDAVVMRTCGGGGCCVSEWFDVLCGARPRGSGATSPAPRIGGIVLVIRAGGRTRVDFGSANKSADGSSTRCPVPPCTKLISSFTAVDSVFAMKDSPEKLKTGSRSRAHGELRIPFVVSRETA